jgi:hypothetical protein
MNGANVWPLAMGGAPGVQITCTSADTNYAASANIPSGTIAIEIYSPYYDALVAIGEATVNGSSSVGRWVSAGIATPIALKASDVTTGAKVNIQSHTAGAVVQITYLSS